jgi:hypothetical protein
MSPETIGRPCSGVIRGVGVDSRAAREYPAVMPSMAVAERPVARIFAEAAGFPFFCDAGRLVTAALELSAGRRALPE